ncbi:MAG: type I phosphomannose isomerase catalytic subunit [Ginsengibacter sp.]
MTNIPGILLVSGNRVWRTYPGGKILDTLEGKSPPEDSHFSEEWIVSTTRAINKGRETFVEGYSKVEVNGNSFLLKDLIEDNPLELIGDTHYKKYGANTQFLLKFLDSAIRLHIQAHPTIAFSQKYLNSNSGKTEAYVILGTREEESEPFIYLGFQHPMAKEDFKQAVLQQDSEKILSCFDKIHIQPGDVFIVPGGLPHAIGEGVFMIEIMEPTDFVVRLEFEKAGYVLPEEARFMGRSIDFAMDMIEFKPLTAEDIKQRYFCKPVSLNKESNYEEFILIGNKQTNCFSVRKMNIKGTYTRSSDCFHAGIVTKGEGIIKAGKEIISIKRGDKFLVPFKTKEVIYTASTELEIVLTFPPGAY